jgi:hypothetical protein
MNTRLWVRVKIFCCDRNGALSKKLHCYRKKIAKIKFLMVTKKSYKTTRLGAKNLGKLANFANIEKTLINWRVLALVKIITHISDTPCVYIFFL